MSRTRTGAVLASRNGVRVIGWMVYKPVDSKKIRAMRSELHGELPGRPGDGSTGALLAAICCLMLTGGASAPKAPIQALDPGLGRAAMPGARRRQQPVAEDAPQAVPGFWDPRRRPDRPDMSRITVIRFLTETDYPPFNFTGPDGNPGGLQCRSGAADLRRDQGLLHHPDAPLRDAGGFARRQPRRRHHRLAGGDAAAARAGRLQRPYYRAPARFVSRRDAVLPEIRPEFLEGKKVGAIAGSAHEAFLKAQFTDAQIALLPQRRRASPGACGAARSTTSSATRSRWRSGSTAPIPPIAAPSAAGRSSKPLFRRRHRHRGAQGQRRAAPGPELGDVQDLGKRPLHRPVAALFLGQSV